MSHLSVDGAQVTKWVPRDASHLQYLTFAIPHSELKSVKGTHMKITSANWTLERNSEKPERLHQEGRHQAPGWLHQSSTHRTRGTSTNLMAPGELHQSGTTGTRRVVSDLHQRGTMIIAPKWHHRHQESCTRPDFDRIRWRPTKPLRFPTGQN